MVAIPQELQDKYQQVQGAGTSRSPTSGNLNACKTPPAQNLNAMMKDNGGDKMENIAKSIGMDEKCQKQSRTYSDQSMFDTDTMAGAITLFGGGMATNSTTDTKNINDDSMMESGCGSFSVAAATILNETANISCTLNSALQGSSTEVKAGARITIRTVRPSQEVIANNNSTIKAMQAKIAETAQKDIPAYMMRNEKVAMYRYDKLEKSIESLSKSLELYILNNSSNATVRNSSFNLKIDQAVTLKSDQKLEASHIAKLEESIKSIAGAAAEQKMAADMGFRAGSANTKQIIKQKIDNVFKSEKKNIDEKITNSFVKAESSTEVIMEIQGGIEGSSIIVDMMVQTNVQSSQAVTSGIEIGQRVAAELEADILTMSETEVKAAGFDDLVREANEGLAKQQKAKGESDAASLGAMGDAMSGMFSGFGLLIMLPLLIFLGVLFFAPKLVSGFIPPQLKIPIMIGIVVLIVLLIFGGVFSSSNRRRFPVSTEFMSVSGDRADTLGYMITNTKGRINKKPYEDFNFTAGGTWQI
tara:strand:- start:58 stop:1644 length:1587 start_codon:yes stop_codon:yes gene_type:complete